ncbi:MAG: hypothetical protein K5859_02515 [Atopobiaceae bacterium]|nr:hypothetical protein [Atopobiaceae bacterium]
MAVENVLKFGELIKGDEALQAKMKEASEAFAGDSTDEKAVFEAVVAPLAAEVGLPFTYEEVAELAAAQEIDDSDLDAVAGGFAYCFGIGISNGPDVNIDHACAYIGFSTY